MIKPILVSIFAALALNACTTTPKSAPSKQNEPKIPYLKSAEIKTIWIPDRIEGNKYEEGHFIHLIDKAATWGGQ